MNVLLQVNVKVSSVHVFDKVPAMVQEGALWPMPYKVIRRNSKITWANIDHVCST